MVCCTRWAALRRCAGAAGTRAPPRPAWALAFGLPRLAGSRALLIAVERAGVDIVDVTPGSTGFPGIINNALWYVRCTQMAAGGSWDVLLAGAEHARDPLDRPVLAGPREVEQNLGIFGGMLYAHAAVAVGAGLRFCANMCFSGVSC